MTDMYDSRDVAAYIARECKKNNFYYNNTKIQKLLYCAYGIVLVTQGIILCNESPRCWPYGPVFPKVFTLIDSGEDISKRYSGLDNSNNEILKSTINDTVKHFGQFTATSLSFWSHLPDSPWDKTKNENSENWNTVIPIEYIFEYFKSNVIDTK